MCFSLIADHVRNPQSQSSLSLRALVLDIPYLIADGLLSELS
jgi:hypothetical protein